MPRRLPPLDEQFDAFVKHALGVAGPNVCQEWLQEVWETHGRDLDDASSHLMECKLRRKMKMRPSSSGSNGSRRSSRGGMGGRSSSCSAVGRSQNSTASTDFSVRGREENTGVRTPPPVAPLGTEEAPTAATADATSETIQVVARFRPFSENELEVDPDTQAVDFGPDGRTCAIAVETQTDAPKAEVEFQFNRVFQPMASQDDIYESCVPRIVESAINGINGAIIAYGQTGSGKTHTMMGPQGAKALIDGNFDDPELGLIPRALLDLQNHAARSDGAVTLMVSYIEIYQEKVKDLLVKAKDRARTDREIRTESNNGLHLPEVTQMQVETALEAMEVMRLGNKHRTKAETKMNSDSSRSHAIFVVSITNAVDPARVKVSQLYLVDLAGSERADKTGVWGKQLDEAKLINKSLLALGQVIWNLSQGAAHVPYRDSKLTRVLQNALGGNARTCLICTASPHPQNANESLSTMRFGSRASHIRNEAKMNIALDANELKKLLDKAQEEIAELRRENADLKQQLNYNQSFPPKQDESFHQDQHIVESSVFSPASRTRAEVQHHETDLQVVKQNVSRSQVAPDVAMDCGMASQQQIAELVAQRLFTRELLPSMLCPINRTIMRDPVCAADGHTYERLAVESLMKNAGRMPAMSPMTMRNFPSKQVFPNIVMKQLIASNQRRGQLPPMEAPAPMFARISIYVLEYMFEFLPGKYLARAQLTCPDFYAVGTQQRLWTSLVSAELGVRDKLEDPRAHFIELKIQKGIDEKKAWAAKRESRVKQGLHLLAPAGR